MSDLYVFADTTERDSTVSGRASSVADLEDSDEYEAIAPTYGRARLAMADAGPTSRPHCVRVWLQERHCGGH